MYSSSKKYIYQRKKVVLSVILAVLMLLPSTAIGRNTHAYLEDEQIRLEDDCQSLEVNIDKIISPPSSGPTGKYPVIVDFTAVGIDINGTKDQNMNGINHFDEPWIEHEKSFPDGDNDAEPKIHFYTSCDEKFMYIAFENETGSLTSAEIFIDENEDSMWDINNDSRLTISIDSNNISDENGYNLSGGKVSWGNRTFVEIGIPKTNWSNCNDWAYVVYSDSYSFCPPDGNPSWDDTNEQEPPLNDLLNFTCEYPQPGCSYTYSCGLKFKAWVDYEKYLPGECHTIYQTGFENLTLFNSTWYKISKSNNPVTPPDSDTWNRSTRKSYNGSYSVHCTDNEEYNGNALDTLEMKEPLDASNALNMSFSFYHWCKGDIRQHDNGWKSIEDFGDIEIFIPAHDTETETWMSLYDLNIIENYFYNTENSWEPVDIKIDRYTIYSNNVSGEDLLTDQTKFRFVWNSSPQFHYEGWYIDDIKIIICENGTWITWLPGDGQGHVIEEIYFGSTKTVEFPLESPYFDEGLYKIIVCVQGEPPWHNTSNCYEKEIRIREIHDVAVTNIDSPDYIQVGNDLYFNATVYNAGTYDYKVGGKNGSVKLKATLSKDGQQKWYDEVTLPSLNISKSAVVPFIWPNAEYCTYDLEVKAILSNRTDAIPYNNTDNKDILVANITTVDDMEYCEWKWKTFDLTGGEGHWRICSSGNDPEDDETDNYLWCGKPGGIPEYSNNLNDVATIKQTFDLTDCTDIFLNFSTYYKIDVNDFGYVEISYDGGKYWNITNFYTGNSSWKEESIDITGNNNNNVKIRFRFNSNESNVLSGWIINDVYVTGKNNTGHQITLFNDSFESGTGKWIIERARAGDWWIKTEHRSSSPSHSWYCGDNTDYTYQPNLINVLQLKTEFALDFSKSFEAHILFDTWYDIVEGDEGYIEVKKVGESNASWTKLKSFNGTSDEGGSDWITEKAKIPSKYLGINIEDYDEADKLLIRFNFTSNNNMESEGWYIDDLLLARKLDTTPPVTSFSIINDDKHGEWYTHPHAKIHLEATDDHSSTNEIITYYKLDGVGPYVYEGDISIPEGELGRDFFAIEYWSVDEIGNTESHKHVEEIKKDSIAPNVTITRPTGGFYWRDKKIWPLIEFSLLEWSTPLIIRDITIVASVNDATSGIDRVEFYIDSVLESTDTTAPYEWNWDETVFFTHTIEVKAYDAAGHMDTASKTVRIFNINLFGN